MNDDDLDIHLALAFMVGWVLVLIVHLCCA